MIKLKSNFCEKLLQDKRSACNATVYGELGSFTLFVNRCVRIIKY